MELALQPTVSLNRTTLMLPLRLKQLAVERARQEGISFGEFVRRAIERQLAVTGRSSGDPFWDNLAVYDTGGPTDISQNHDAHLYGEERGEKP